MCNKVSPVLFEFLIKLSKCHKTCYISFSYSCVTKNPKKLKLISNRFRKNSPWYFDPLIIVNLNFNDFIYSRIKLFKCFNNWLEKNIGFSF